MNLNLLPMHQNLPAERFSLLVALPDMGPTMEKTVYLCALIRYALKRQLCWETPVTALPSTLAATTFPF